MPFLIPTSTVQPRNLTHAISSCPDSPHFSRDASPFLLDLRAVGLFRVLLAVLILVDQIVRLCDWNAFHSVFGVLSLADSRSWGNSWVWSLYWLSDAPILPYILEIVRLLATITLLFGIRSRASAFVLFVLLASVAVRNPCCFRAGTGSSSS